MKSLNAGGTMGGARKCHHEGSSNGMAKDRSTGKQLPPCRHAIAPPMDGTGRYDETEMKMKQNIMFYFISKVVIVKRDGNKTPVIFFVSCNILVIIQKIHIINTT